MTVAKTTSDPNDSIERGELDEMIGIALNRAYNGAYRYFYKSMDPELKPGYYTSLSLVLKNPGMTQKALAHAIQRDPSSVVPMLDAFQKKNWITRRRSESDRRAHELYLTPAGRAAAKRFDKDVSRIEAEMADHLGLRGSRQLKQLLKRLESFFDAVELQQNR